MEENNDIEDLDIKDMKLPSNAILPAHKRELKKALLAIKPPNKPLISRVTSLFTLQPIWKPIITVALIIALVVSSIIVIPPMLSTDIKVMATDIALNSPEVINAFIDDSIESTKVIEETDDVVIVELIGGSGDIVTVVVNLNSKTVMSVLDGPLQYYPVEDLGKVISILMSDNEIKSIFNQGATINRLLNYHTEQIANELTEKRVYISISLASELYITDIDFIGGQVLEFGDYDTMEAKHIEIRIFDLYERLEDPNLSEKRYMEIIGILVDLGDEPVFISDLYERLEDPNLSDNDYLEILEILKSLGEKPVDATEAFIAELYERLENPNLSEERFIKILGILGTFGEYPVIIKEPWLPEGLGIIFVRYFEGLGGEIYGMNADGSNQTNLTNSITLERKPVLSPDGSQIVFISSSGGDTGICIMNADGTNKTSLTAGSDAAWSPDGTKIAFSYYRGENLDIYVMNTDGSNQTRLTDNLGREYYPRWSPDGSQIAFVSNRDGNYEISVMNADGSNQTQITNNPARDYTPAWSPDGSQIAFVSNRDGNYEIYVMNADGSNQTRLTNNPFSDRQPVWSNDGSRIAFGNYWGEDVATKEIHVMNADGSNQTRLTYNSSRDEHTAWSPDDSMIVFVSQRDGNNEIYVMNSDGSNQARLTNNSVSDRYPIWLP